MESPKRTVKIGSERKVSKPKNIELTTHKVAKYRAKYQQYFGNAKYRIPKYIEYFGNNTEEYRNKYILHMEIPWKYRNIPKRQIIGKPNTGRKACGTSEGIGWREYGAGGVKSQGYEGGSLASILGWMGKRSGWQRRSAEQQHTAAWMWVESVKHKCLMIWETDSRYGGWAWSELFRHYFGASDSYKKTMLPQVIINHGRRCHFELPMNSDKKNLFRIKYLWKIQKVKKCMAVLVSMCIRENVEFCVFPWKWTYGPRPNKRQDCSLR